MEPRTVGRSLRDGGAAHAEDESWPGAGPDAVIAGARRRAVRDGDRQIDTAHLLHSLLESDPEARDAIGTPAQLARLLGYLVQRSIGYGLTWQRRTEVSAAAPAPAAVEGWSPLAATAMRDAHARARARGARRAGGLDLLGALVADPDARAVEVLERAGVRAAGLRDRLAPPPSPRSSR